MQIKNLKVTTARKELLELLDNQNKPISFDDIKNEITMDKATFYRNISKFEDESMVHSFESNDKKRYYEIQRTPHAHFICNNCNAINCLHKPISLKLDGCCITDMIFKGLCKQCNTTP
jgi:Fur family ferric uptake transcriptional regulator